MQLEPSCFPSHMLQMYEKVFFKDFRLNKRNIKLTDEIENVLFFIINNITYISKYCLYTYSFIKFKIILLILELNNEVLRVEIPSSILKNQYNFIKNREKN